MLQTGIRRAAALLLGASVALLMPPGLVVAHAELKTATPADKSTVSAPVTEVSGIYTEAMTPSGSSLVVKDATGAVVARGTVDPADDTRMMATPASPLDNGAYRVESTSVATDGHVEHATWTFTVAVSPTPITTTAASAAATPSPTPVAVTPSPPIAPTPEPTAGGSSGIAGSGGDVVLPIVLALIILGAGAAYLLSRRNRPPSAT